MSAGDSSTSVHVCCDGGMTNDETGPDQTPDVDANAGAETTAKTETDVLVEQIDGPEDKVGMAALWRMTMGMDKWWFVAVGEEGQESPAAATIDDRNMLLAFTNAERARHFAVEQNLIDTEEGFPAIALPPEEVVGSAEAYTSAGIDGVIFDAHISGYFIPVDQMAPVWEAVMSPSAEN